MARKSRSNPKNAWRQSILAAERGTKRIARKKRTYDPLRWARDHAPIRNQKFKLKGKGKGLSHIDLPKSLNFDTKQSADEVTAIVNRVRNDALFERKKKVVLNFQDVAHISPEVAVLMLAEIQRCRAYCTGRTQLTGTYPREHSVAELLNEIGFYDALNVQAPKLPASYTPRTYVKVERENQTLARVADQLLACFSEEYSFVGNDRRNLHIALIECMDNVYQHAYSKTSKDPHLYKEWWMAGYADHRTGEIAFVFYDQGLGIPSTITTKKPQRVLDRLRTWSDAQWIERAIRKRISRFDSKRRGHGLEKLKRFLERDGQSGSLTVSSGRGHVRLTSGHPPQLIDLSSPIAGCLVVWSLMPSGEWAYT